MAVGKSHRIVIEVEPETKQQIYSALKAEGMTLKEWFLNQITSNLLNEQGKKDDTTTKEN